MPRDLFGDTQGLARHMLIAMAIRATLAIACGVPVVYESYVNVPDNPWIGYIVLIPVIWAFVGDILVIILLVKRTIAGKIFAWLLVAELSGGILFGVIEMHAAPQFLITIFGSSIFLYFIFLGLISPDLKEYYANSGGPADSPPVL